MGTGDGESCLVLHLPGSNDTGNVNVSGLISTRQHGDCKEPISLEESIAVLTFEGVDISVNSLCMVVHGDFVSPD